MLLSLQSGDYALYARHPAYGTNIGPTTGGNDIDGGGVSGQASRGGYKCTAPVDFQPHSGSYQTASGDYYACGYMQVDWTNKNASTENFDALRFFDSAGANSWRLLITCADSSDTTYDLSIQYNAAGTWTTAGTVSACLPNLTEAFWEFKTNNNTAGSNSGYLRVPGFAEVTWSGLTVTYKAEGIPLPHSLGNTGKETGIPIVYDYSVCHWDSSATGTMTGPFTTVTAGTVDALSRDMDVYSYYPDADGAENDYAKSDGHAGGTGKGFCLVDDPEDTESGYTGTITGGGASDEQELVFNLPGVSPSSVDGVTVVISLDGTTLPSEVHIKGDGESYGYYTAAGGGGATGKWYSGDTSGGSPKTIWIPLPRTPAGTNWTPALLTGMTIKLKGATSGVQVVQIDVLGQGLNRMTKNDPCRFAPPFLPTPVRNVNLRR